MSDLESRCRWLLRAYPRAFRDRYGEELVSTLLDVAGDRERLSVATALSMVVHGVGYRLRAVPDGRAAAVVAGEIALCVAVVGAVGTPLLGAWVGTGYVAGSVTGCVLWGVLAVSLLATRFCRSAARVVSTVMVGVVGAVAYEGGAELMGALRPFIAAFLLAAALAAMAPRPGRARAVIGAVVCVVVAVVLAASLAWRVDHGYSRHGPFDMDRIWSGVPWLYVELGALVPTGSLLAVGAIALVAGWFRPRVALTAALLAMPMAVIAFLLHRSVWFQGGGSDLSTLAATIGGGAAATVTLTVVGRRPCRASTPA